MSGMPRTRWPALLATLACMLAAACAPEVHHRPTQLSATPEETVVMRLATDTPVKLDTEYLRLLRRDTRWRAVGKLREGVVYKPIDNVLTVEGANVHEAWLVVDGNRLVGFYLPVEGAFSPVARQPVLQITR